MDSSAVVCLVQKGPLGGRFRFTADIGLPAPTPEMYKIWLFCQFP